MNGPNKLDIFAPSRPYQLSFMFVVKARRDRSLPLKSILLDLAKTASLSIYFGYCVSLIRQTAMPSTLSSKLGNLARTDLKHKENKF